MRALDQYRTIQEHRIQSCLETLERRKKSQLQIGPELGKGLPPQADPADELLSAELSHAHSEETSRGAKLKASWSGALPERE